MSNRLAYIDIVKCTAIWLVLWGHAITELMPNELKDNPVYVGIYAFHMPLFMLVSGLFAEKSLAEVGFWQLVKKKFNQLIYPAIGFFGIVWFMIENDNLFSGSQIHYTNWLVSFAKHEFSCYWFLKSLFVCYATGWVCWRFNRYKWYAAVVCLIVFLAIQRWDITVFKMGYMLPFFFLGILLRQRLGWVQMHSVCIGVISAVIFLVGLQCYGLEYSFQGKLFREMALMSFCGYGYYLLMGMAGSMMIICGTMAISGKFARQADGYDNSIFIRIGQQTLMIYLWQKLLLELLLPMVVQVRMELWVYNWLFTPMVATASLFAIYYLSKFRLKD